MKIVKTLLLFAVIAGTAELCTGYRILGIYPLPVKSHFIMIKSLLKGFARKGHQVDVASIFPPDNENITNYKQIMTFPDNSKEIMGILTFELIKNFGTNISLIGEFGNNVCKSMGTPEFLALARNPPKDPPYDVIITHTMNYHCFMVLGHLWKIPVVLVSTTSLYPWMHDMIANPENIAFSPNNMIPIPEDKTFWTRYINTHMFYMLKFGYLYYTRVQNELLQKYFGPDVPSVRELERSTSLVLMNTYFPLNGIKSMAKGVIEVGGLHIQNEGPELDNKLKKWLDESKDGVIYFTLGSMFRIETFPEEIVNIIFNSLEKRAPMKVLIRIANPEELKVKLPKNFYTLSWMPQEKILQHPNVKVFITHGGLLGTQESVYYGVPMLCMPLLADQSSNTNNYVAKKIAVKVNLMSLTQKDYDEAVNEIVENPIYRENVKKLSSLFRDRPQSAMDTAAFWVEFVIRNGKDSLKSPAMDLTWWQVALLDVLIVDIVALLAVLFVIIVVLKLLLRLIFCRKRKNVSIAKKRS